VVLKSRSAVRLMAFWLLAPDHVMMVGELALLVAVVSVAAAVEQPVPVSGEAYKLVP
jgi:hypothetical protein